MKLAALALLVLTLPGCALVRSYRFTQEENDRQALIRDYRQCVEAGVRPQYECDAYMRAGIYTTLVVERGTPY